MANRQLLVLLAAVCCSVVFVSESVSAVCYDFESNPGGFSYAQYNLPDYWKWTGDGNNPSGIDFKNIPPSSRYLWSSDYSGAVTTSPSFSGVYSTSVFEFSYYADIQDPSSNSDLNVFFQSDDGAPLIILDTFRVGLGSVWTMITLDCVGRVCCLSYPCSGKLTFKVSAVSPYYHTLFAIDNVQLDGGCGTAPTTTPATTTTPAPTTTTPVPTTTTPIAPTTTTTYTPGYGCCTFSVNSCGFILPNPPNTNNWEWTGYGNYPTPSLFPSFPSSGNYIFSENNDAALAYSTTYDIVASTEFGLKYYVDTNDISSHLLVYFYNKNGGQPVLIDILDDTDNTWQTKKFTCGTSSCCNSYPCTGQIQFEARVNNFNALFAVEEVEVNNACSL